MYRELYTATDLNMHFCLLLMYILLPIEGHACKSNYWCPLIESNPNALPKNAEYLLNDAMRLTENGTGSLKVIRMEDGFSVKKCIPLVSYGVHICTAEMTYFVIQLVCQLTCCVARFNQTLKNLHSSLL